MNSLQSLDLVADATVEGSQKSIKEVKFSQDIVIKHTQPEEKIDEGVGAIDDKFENLGGDNSLNLAI